MQVAVEKKRFLDVFPEVVDLPDVAKLFEDVSIVKSEYFYKQKKAKVMVEIPRLIPYKYITALEKRMARGFSLHEFKIIPNFSIEENIESILDKYWESILFIVKQELAMSRGLLYGSTYKLEGNVLKIYLKVKGAEILKSHRCDNIIQQKLRELFNYDARVVFDETAIELANEKEYLEQKLEQEHKLASVIKAPIVQTHDKPAKSDKSSDGDVIKGKKFSDQVMQLKDVTLDSGKVAVCGEIFDLEFREIRGDRYILTFDITDYTSSITIKFFVDKNDFDYYKESMKKGMCVKVRGEAQYDKFSKELVLMAYDILKSEKEKKIDTAGIKRVELHLHSQMSAMDGVTPVGDLVKRAAEWGHKAIAITDHGVVQAYPEAFSAGKKNGIRIIYGVECYILDDSVPIVISSRNQSLDDEFVVFDLETTGLSSNTENITEIGAVKISKGEIVDTFSTFVNPEKPIPEEITKLTGISDLMVENAPKVEEALKDFKDFVGDAVLVAHNAKFDMSFINHYARKYCINMENTVLDTLELCRKLFPELKKHKLNIVAEHLGISLENHHRAVDDAGATGEIFIKCIEILKGKEIKNIDEIQERLGEVFDYRKSKSYHAIILAQTQAGLKNLYKIISESHLKYFYKKPRVPKKLFTKYRDGLIIGSACEAGELYRAILENASEDHLEAIAGFYDYLEIQPLGNNRFLIENGKVSSEEELKNINRKIIKLGEKLNKLVVATCDVHFMDPRDEVYRRILMAGQGYTDADNQAPLYFRTTDEMLQEFSYLGEKKAFEVVVENTNKIADMFEEIAPVPSGTFPPNIEGAEEEIKMLAETRAREIYGDPLPKVVEERLEKELNSIIKNGFSVMYLIAQKLVSKSLSDGYLVGSRGSVGSSFVANMAGITEVNSLQPHYICTNPECKYSEFILDGSYDCGFDMPAKDCPKCGRPLKKDGYDIPFETFLGFDGDKEPDIDLNFSGEYQPVAHKYTEELFGEGHVFRAGTIGTVAEKTAFGFIKNYLDERGNVVTNAEIKRLVKGCTGVKRTTGQHPGGIMIVPQDKEIFDFSPIQRPADDTDSSIITTHFDYHFLHGSILKLDILGHDDPTVIRMLEDLTGVDAKTIPIGEETTMGIFSSTKPLGIKPEDINSEVGTFAIPEFGTKFVRQMLVDTKPTTFSELIRISGLSHGTDVWLNNAQDLIRDGITTLSQCICCRDDIMIYLLHKNLPPKSSFKIMEDVRKGKGLKDEYIEIMKENNVPQWYIDSCTKIKYMFPKAHAAAYVMMAFRIAWFKVYYPHAFYVTYYTVRADDFDAEMMCHGKDKVKLKIKEYEAKGNGITTKEKNILTILEVVNEMYARGIEFLPVDLYKSDAVKFIIEEGRIRPPLNSLQGLGSAAAQNIAEARKQGAFLSIEDLRIKAKISKAVIEILEKNNVLENMEQTNQMTLF